MSDVVIVWDVETTELIDCKNVPISRMEISVACALVLDANSVLKNDTDAIMEQAERRVYWHVDRGRPGDQGMEHLATALANCKLHVAFNGKRFDMIILRKYFRSESDYDLACRRMYDPWDDLSRSIGSFSLASLLQANGLAKKTAKGCEAPGMWVRKEYDVLENYCAADVDRLARLVLLPTIRIPSHPIRLPIGTIRTLLEEMDASAADAAGLVEIKGDTQ